MSIQTKVGWRSAVAPATSYLLDTYSGAAAAYSLRKLRTAYTGNAITVRRSSDNTSQDIGFDTNGNLDTTSLLAFVGSNNTALYSEEFDNVWWNKNNVTVTANQTMAPDGTMTADLLSESGTSNHTIGNTVTSSTFTPGTSWNVSVYLKKGPGTSAPDTIALSFNNGNILNTPSVLFNISTGVVVTSSNTSNDANFGSSIVDVGGGWWRCAMWGTTTISQGRSAQYGVIRFNNNLNTITIASYAGNVQANVYIWGYQFVRALNDTSVLTTKPYTKTTTTAAGNGFVSTWFDQSGNDRDLTQATAANQPQIVSSGSLITRSGKPYFTCSTTQFFTLANTMNFTTTPYSMWMTYEKSATGNNAVISSSSINYMWLDYRTQQYLSTRPSAMFSISPELSINTRYLINGIVNVANTGGNNVTSSLYTNSTLRGSSATSVTWGGSYASTQAFPASTSSFRIGTITTNEWIVYNSNKTTDRTGIESNINSYYSIY